MFLTAACWHDNLDFFLSVIMQAGAFPETTPATFSSVFIIICGRLMAPVKTR